VNNWLTRGEQLAQDEATLTATPTVLQIRPPLGSPTVSRAARDAALMLRALDIGRAAALDALSWFAAAPA